MGGELPAAPRHPRIAKEPPCREGYERTPTSRKMSWTGGRESSARRTLRSWLINRKTVPLTMRGSGRDMPLHDFVPHDFVPFCFPESTRRDSQNHEEQNHGETIKGWASDIHKVRRTLARISTPPLGLVPWSPRWCYTVAHQRGNHPDKRGGGETIFARLPNECDGVTARAHQTSAVTPSCPVSSPRESATRSALGVRSPTPTGATRTRTHRCGHRRSG